MNTVDAEYVLRTINSELQRFIDVELKGTLNDMKNSFFEQQFGFERQLCALFDKLQR
jgi:hypothetical protein